jgi:hypothetical protein
MAHLSLADQSRSNTISYQAFSEAAPERPRALSLA